ncbi:MAG: CsbD family protein [Anaerolineales bacterium]|nr:CsbD family protein [Anaerolineales bacterium]
MNEDIFKGKWKQIRGKAKEWWADLTDDDLDKIDGRWDQLVGKVQERYGYTKEEALAEVESHMHEFESEPHTH